MFLVSIKNVLCNVKEFFCDMWEEAILPAFISGVVAGGGILVFLLLTYGYLKLVYG
jgi:hypothetical protein